MDIFTIAFWIIAIVLTVISFIKDKKKTFAAMKKSKGMMGNMLGEIIAIISPNIFPIIPFDFFIAANVFFLSFMNEITVRTIAIIQNAIVNISILNLLILI